MATTATATIEELSTTKLLTATPEAVLTTKPSTSKPSTATSLSMSSNNKPSDSTTDVKSTTKTSTSKQLTGSTEVVSANKPTTSKPSTSNSLSTPTTKPPNSTMKTSALIAKTSTTSVTTATTTTKTTTNTTTATTKAKAAVIQTIANKNNDDLIEILKQIQARKTVKPEDATKALQQYHKVQEHIKALKSEIEIFKADKAKQENQSSASPKSVVKASSTGTVTRKNSLKSVNTTKQTTPTKLPTRTLNGLPEDDTAPVKGGRRPSKAFVNGHDKLDKFKPSAKEDRPREEKQQVTKEAGEKDRELPRISGRISESSPKSSMLEQRDIPNQQKLVEEFKRIHDMEYRTAFHDLEKQYKLAEDNITDLLAAIAREAYTFCQNSSKQQFDDIVKAHANVIDALVQPKYSSQFKDTVTSKSKSIVDKDGYVVTRKFLKDYRRAMARVPIPGLVEIFESVVQRDVLTRHSSLRIIPKSSRPYMNRLIEVNWLMSLHEPPMAQVWPRGGQLMNRDWFTPYSKKGATVIHTVWPALFYHKEGSLAERGICVVK